jgi:two-component system chemotaxis response regulator CheY
MKHCLIADDSAVVRKVGRRIVEALPLRVSEAEDALQALTVCREDMPDAIILDSAMPGLDSVTFLKNLRGMPGGTRPKVLLCATDNDVGQIARAMHAGANAYMLKPFDRELVTAKLEEVGVIRQAAPAPAS